jgi:hypothetical protein
LCGKTHSKEDKDMEKPDRNNKKYYYYHKKANKKMFNFELFSKDIDRWKKLKEKEDNL